MLMERVADWCEEIASHDLLRVSGPLRSATGLLLTCAVPASVGEQCSIRVSDERTVLVEVIGFTEDGVSLVPYEHSSELRPGLPVTCSGRQLTVPVGKPLLGRVLDGLGRPMDGKGSLAGCEMRRVRLQPPPPLRRARIREPFVTGQRALDGMLTLGWGQRVGIFAGSGVGKSTLLGEIAKGSDAQVNVIALIGERGREVREFIEGCLGPEGLRRSVVVVATCDQSPLMRVRAAHTAITLADHFRSEGGRVLFLLDSLTRLAMAQRELGLALGEPPSARGYTPSVFQLLAATVEQLGNDERGSVTGILTVLVDGGDFDEPISDAVRAMVDGHIVLDRRLAERGQYPAINIAQSISRIFAEVTEPGHQASTRKVRDAQATYAEAEDLIRIGAYVRGSSPQIDRAMDLHPTIEFFLKQEVGKRTAYADTKAALDRIAAAWPF